MRPEPSPAAASPHSGDAPITRAAKDELLRANRQRLDEDLITQRLVWRSLPRVVDLQLSNICNMACTMCYDGNNPPPRKLSTEAAERVARELLPTAATIVPFAGSEPLIVTWDLTKKLAVQYDVELELITNAQFLDEAKFYELEPHVSSVTFSIDSHMRDVYERIRLRSQPDKVFTNLPRAARLCREHGIEPVANVVLMVENAAFMDETVAFLADQGCTTVRILAFHMPYGANAERSFSDAIQHMSPRWIEWMLGKMRAVAQRKGIRLMYEGLTRFEHDHRPKDLQFRQDRKALHTLWEELPYYFPGYCVQSVDRVKVTTEGDVYPCCVAEGDQVWLGNIHKSSIQEIWNGPNAQDLRRGMLTLDLPKYCQGCGFHTAFFAPERDALPMVDWYHDAHCGGALPRLDATQLTLPVDGPEHMTRTEAAPTFRWQPPDEPVDEFHLVLGIAGTWHAQNRVVTIPGDADEFALPEATWRALPANIAVWWCVYGIRKSNLAHSVRTPKLRCLVRHQPIPRVPGSTLYAPDAAAAKPN